MAEKLKLTLRQIHWSLILKGAIFAAAWFWLPFWLFFLLALVLYLVPWFEPWKTLSPFLVLLLLCLIATHSIGVGLVLGLDFLFIIGIKDLAFINRKNAYYAFILLSFFLLSLELFKFFNKGISVWSLGGAVFFAGLYAILIKDFSKYEPDDKNGSMVSITLSFLLLEAVLVLSFAPFGYLYQAAMAFTLVFVFTQFLLDKQGGTLNSKKILLYFSTAFVVCLICVLLLNPAI